MKKQEILEGNNINKAANQFISQVYATAPDSQKEQVKEIFFAGALYHYSLICRMGEDDITDKDIEKVNELINKEFDHFEAQLKAKA